MCRRFLLATVFVLALTAMAGGAEQQRRTPLSGTVIGAPRGVYEVYGVNLNSGNGVKPRDLCVSWRKGKRIGEFIVVWVGPTYSLVVPRKGTHAVLLRGDEIIMSGAVPLPPTPPRMPTGTVVVTERDLKVHMQASEPTFTLPTWGLPSSTVPNTWSNPSFEGPSWSLPGWSLPGWSLPSVGVGGP